MKTQETSTSKHELGIMQSIMIMIKKFNNRLERLEAQVTDRTF